MKKVALMVLGTAMQTYGDRLTDEQEVLTLAADVIIDVYAAESTLLRAAAAGGRAARSGRARLHQRRCGARRGRGAKTPSPQWPRETCCGR